MLTSADRTELADLVSRYAARVDDRSSVAELFADDAALAMPSPPQHLTPVTVHTGLSEINGALSALDEFPVTRHAIVGAVFDGDTDDGTAATGRVACVAHHLSRRPSGELGDVIWHLLYRDSYRKDGEVWCFARREVHIEWIEAGKPRHWRIDGQEQHR